VVNDHYSDMSILRKNKQNELANSKPRTPVQFVESSGPTVDSLLKEALTVLASEISRYRAKSDRGSSLTLSEARVLNGYIKSLLDLSEEARERDKEQDLSNLSNEEMLELAGKFMSQVKTAATDKKIENATVVTAESVNSLDENDFNDND